MVASLGQSELMYTGYLPELQEALPLEV